MNIEKLLIYSQNMRAIEPFFSMQCIITLWDSLLQYVMEAWDINRFRDCINGG